MLKDTGSLIIKLLYEVNIEISNNIYNQESISNVKKLVFKSHHIRNNHQNIIVKSLKNKFNLFN